ncbi:hypothetical protein LMG26411_01561 [Cupriavidus numazuensis]|uniref:Uncharacterized protein n=1 Tax=Cupriavidus numazuensis TaxID=221992 RepID=A0ABM8TDE9_9BURK|nr:hypothetical protein LMG26411_01561 [Cupriavidus numazuensis]
MPPPCRPRTQVRARRGTLSTVLVRYFCRAICTARRPARGWPARPANSRSGTVDQGRSEYGASWGPYVSPIAPGHLSTALFTALSTADSTGFSTGPVPRLMRRADACLAGRLQHRQRTGAPASDSPARPRVARDHTGCDGTRAHRGNRHAAVAALGLADCAARPRRYGLCDVQPAASASAGVCACRSGRGCPCSRIRISRP